MKQNTPFKLEITRLVYELFCNKARGRIARLRRRLLGKRPTGDQFRRCLSNIIVEHTGLESEYGYRRFTDRVALHLIGFALSHVEWDEIAEQWSSGVVSDECRSEEEDTKHRLIMARNEEILEAKLLPVWAKLAQILREMSPEQFDEFRSGDFSDEDRELQERLRYLEPEGSDEDVAGDNAGDGNEPE